MSNDARGVVEAVKDTIYRSCLLLDEQKWDEWLALCDDDFHYAVRAYSPEIHHDMTYYEADRSHLTGMIDMLPKHNTDHSPMKRHVTVYSVDVDEADGTATAVTSVVVYQTLFDGINAHLDAGETRLFVAGKYVDRLRVDNGAARFVDREVRLETRRLDKGTHWPI
jgi:methanesulfonate monooxygenase small subunit